MLPGDRCTKHQKEMLFLRIERIMREGAKQMELVMTSSDWGGGIQSETEL